MLFEAFLAALGVSGGQLGDLGYFLCARKITIPCYHRLWNLAQHGMASPAITN
jgi:hypothetical protein